MDTCDGGELVDDVEGDDHLDGRTVGVGDDPTWADEGIGCIDLRDDEGDILVVGVTAPSGIVVANEAEPVDVYAAALQLATKMEQIAVQWYRRVILVTSSAVCADGVRGSSSRLARPLKRLVTIRSAAVSTPPRATSEQACSQMFHLGFGARFTMPVESSWTDASTPRRT